jgi:pimeloyl-ACP methyl ester carboxylesterase/DNA-binding CsgD family transcriptional regulator
MDAPTVRYTTTSDGFDIAHLAAGDGPPLVFMPFHFNHLQRRWVGPKYARGLAEGCRVYLYDSRGQGLSTRGLVSDPTLTDYRRDLDAVIEANHLKRFVLTAYGGFGHVAIGYALEHPERVHALILICTSESFAAWPLLTMLPLAVENWELFLHLTQAKNTSDDMRERVVESSKASVTPDDYVRLVRAFARSDVSDLIPRIGVPTLLLHSERQHWLSPEEGMKLAARIPNSRLVFLGGDMEPDDVQVVQATLAFLRDLPPLDPGYGPAAGQTAPAATLSPRQREVLQMLAQGKTTREIAEALVLSERTVQRHIADLYARIGARNRAEATAYELSRVQAVPGIG